jgi:hypothetical protein
MLVRHQFLGLEALLVPFLRNISTQRSNMHAAQVAQSLVINGAEFPKIYTGWEKQFMEYEFNSTHRDHDIQVLAVIPKFQSHIGASQVKAIPSYTIIFIDNETKEVDCIEKKSYTALYNGFGYLNKSVYNVKPGEFVSKDTILSCAPNHDGNCYCQGLNANVAYMTAWDTCEDAFVISESLAKRCAHFAISKVTIPIKETDVPLNIYGSADDYKLMPDIDEEVGSNGLLMAIRELNDLSMLADISEDSLFEPNYLDDELYVAPVGSVVLDVQVFMTNKTYNRLASQPGPYTQLLKYQKHHYAYWEEILKQYKDTQRHGYKIGARFSTLIDSAMHLKAFKSFEEESRTLVLTSGKDPIEFINVEITFGYVREISLGSKFTDRAGA